MSVNSGSRPPGAAVNDSACTAKEKKEEYHESTKQGRDAFGIEDLHMDHSIIKSGDSYFQPVVDASSSSSPPPSTGEGVQPQWEVPGCCRETHAQARTLFDKWLQHCDVTTPKVC